MDLASTSSRATSSLRPFSRSGTTPNRRRGDALALSELVSQLDQEGLDAAARQGDYKASRFAHAVDFGQDHDYEEALAAAVKAPLPGASATAGTAGSGAAGGTGGEDMAVRGRGVRVWWWG